MLDKRLLQRIELVAFGQTLDGENVPAAHPDRQLAARIHIAAVDDHSARAAFAAIAADLGAGETELVAQHLGQGLAVFDFDPIGFAVHFEIDRRFPLGCAGGFRHVRIGSGGTQQTRRDDRASDRAAADALQKGTARYPFTLTFVVHGH
jgi:hypothetical protein